MAKTKAEKTAAAAATAAVAAMQGTDQVLLEDDEDQDLTDAFQALRDLDTSGGKALWEVHCTKKYPYRKEREGYVETIGTEQLTLDHFVNEYGGGVYRLVGKVDNRYVRGLAKKITVAETGREGRHWERAETDGAPPRADSAGDLITRLEQQRIDREAAERRASSDRMKDWAGIITAGATILGPSLAALISRKPAFDPMQLVIAMQAGQPKMADMLALMGKTKEEQGPGSLDAVLKLLDVFQDKLGGAPAGESNWIDLAREAIREILPAARPILQQLADQRAAAQQGASQPMFVSQPPLPSLPTSNSPPQPPGIASNGSPAPSVSPNPAGDDMLAMIKPFLIRKCEDLLEAARENRNIELAAEWLLESIPKLYRTQISAEQLHGWVSRADWWPILSQFYPQLQPYQVWLDEVRQEVLALLAAEIAEQPKGAADAGASVQ